MRAQPTRVPNPLEVEVLMQIKAMVKRLFSTSKVSLVWDVPNQRYVVGVDFDYNIQFRLPPEYFGIPVIQYVPQSAAVLREGSTITYGEPSRGLWNGLSFGTPIISVFGDGLDQRAAASNFCNPPQVFKGDPSGMMPPSGGYYNRCGC